MPTKRYFIAITWDHNERVYEVSRNEQRFILDNFSEEIQYSDLNELHTIKARKRTQYETQSKKGKDEKIPRKLWADLVLLYDFPAERFEHPYWKLDDKIICVGDIKAASALYQLGAEPHDFQPGDTVYNSQRCE